MKTQINNLGKNLRRGSIAVIAAVAFFTVSCESEEMPAPAGNGQEFVNIISTIDLINSNADLIINQSSNYNRSDSEIREFNSSLNILKDALEYTGLAETVSRERFTLLAPTDEAFTKLLNNVGASSIYEIPSSDLAPILLYHVFTDKIYSSQLSSGYGTTASGTSIKVTADSNSKMFNGVNVIATDIESINGVIHIIDDVLLPPTIVDLAAGNENFSILVQAVSKAGLVETLKNGEFTVFAPTNDAFVALLGELGYNSLDEIPMELLTSVLLYHVVPAKVFSTDLPAEPVSVATAHGDSFRIDAAATAIMDGMSREASLVAFDLTGTNGVIHVIDRVILPNLNSISE